MDAMMIEFLRKLIDWITDTEFDNNPKIREFWRRVFELFVERL